MKPKDNGHCIYTFGGNMDNEYCAGSTTDSSQKKYINNIEEYCKDISLYSVKDIKILLNC